MGEKTTLIIPQPFGGPLGFMVTFYWKLLVRFSAIKVNFLLCISKMRQFGVKDFVKRSEPRKAIHGPQTPSHDIPRPYQVDSTITTRCISITVTLCLRLLAKSKVVETIFTWACTIMNYDIKSIQLKLSLTTSKNNYLTTNRLWNNIFNTPKTIHESTSCLLKFWEHRIPSYSLNDKK